MLLSLTKVVALLAIISLFGVHVTADDDYSFSKPIYPAPLGGRISSPAWEQAYNIARDLVSQMTLPEKVNITTGTGWEMGPCVGNTGPVPRLNIPSFCLQDSPLVIRDTDLNSVFPAGLATAATFNKDLVFLRGKAMAQEFKDKGINVLLGPCMGPIGRAPEGGRNWEAFGSDPYLQGVASYHSVLGIQGTGVIATAKHYLLNEQEHFRQYQEWKGFGFKDLEEPYSSNVDERALREIYVWPFADAVRAGVASVMCSYNRVNNSQSCQNSYLLNGVLKDELGFQGFVQSDWLGARSGVPSILAGMDMTMPGDGMSWADGISLLGPNLTIAVLNGTVPMWRLDDMCTRILAAYFKVGNSLDSYEPPSFSSWTFENEYLIYAGSNQGPKGIVNKHVNVLTSLSRYVTHQIASESIVLVKNTNNALPISKKFKRIGLFGSAAGPAPQGPNGNVDRSGNDGTLGIGWGSGSANFPYIITPLEVLNSMAKNYYTSVDYILNDYFYEDTSLFAPYNDAAIVFISSDSGEGYLNVSNNLGDRNNLSAWHEGDKLVKKVASLNNNTIVVIESVGGIDMEKWIDHENVTAVLYSIVPGQDVGLAIAEVLYGAVSPSGKLPFTIAKSKSDYAATVMYEPIPLSPQINFTEGIYIDYRHFDKYDIEPRFEFGFGLTYSSFEFLDYKISPVSGVPTGETAPMPEKYGDLPTLNSSIPSPSSAVYPDDIPRYNRYIYPYITNEEADKIKYDTSAYDYPEGYSAVQKTAPSAAGGGEGGNPALWDVLVQVTTTLKNTGDVAAAEVAQLYISYPKVDGVDFPVRSLRGFEKIMLTPGEKGVVNFDLLRRDLSYWSISEKNWILPRGIFYIWVGNSSRNLKNIGKVSFD
ncbi:glycosyl hydrolase family 3 N terminal domain-containing protein [Dipodascopsis uninucleata]